MIGALGLIDSNREWKKNIYIYKAVLLTGSYGVRHLT